MLIGIPVVMALALSLTAVVSYRNVHSVRDNVIRGEGHAFFHELRSLQPASAVNDPLILQQMIEDGREAGLRCIAVFDAEKNLTASGGQCLGSENELRAALDLRNSEGIIEVENRIRDTTRRPPKGIVNIDERSLPPQLVIEYEPVRANQLMRASGRALALGLVASILLIGAALLVVTLARRAEGLQRQALRDRHLASLGEVAAVISHQIRNPLTSMKGHAQLLAEMLTAESRERDKAERVVHEALRLEHLTTDLLEFVRSRQVHQTDTDPAAMLNNACASFDNNRVSFEVESAPGRWSLDAVKLEQALANLLENALQASEGPVEASVSLTGGDELLFTIRDHGKGIPAGEEEHIFEPFHTTRTQGTGLGLAVARGIVEAHGGSLTAATHDQGGAVMRIRLPRRNT
jgi:two-component system sensor histidine kinase HydH